MRQQIININSIFLLSTLVAFSKSFEPKISINEGNKSRIFSPRMDYDEWTPLGRGDPLKNDPTFDYVPPVLDRVKYWLDTQPSTEPSSSKKDILVLGVTAKKTSQKIPENFLKFVDGPIFMRNKMDTDGNNYRKNFIGINGAEPPNIIRANKFRPNGESTLDFRNQNHNNKNLHHNLNQLNRHQLNSQAGGYYPSNIYYEKNKHFTMMMPPVLMKSPSIPEAINIQPQYGLQTEETPTGLLQPSGEIHLNPHHISPQSYQSISKTTEQSTTSSITFDKSNLIYQSSQTFDPWASNAGYNPSIIWNGKSDIHYDDDHQASGSINHEVIVGQNANIIVDGDTEESGQVVMGKKEIVSLESRNETFPASVNINSGKMHIVLANDTSSSTVNDQKTTNKVTVSVVMPTNYRRPLNASTTAAIASVKTVAVSTEPTTNVKTADGTVSTTPLAPQSTWHNPPGTRVFSRRPAGLQQNQAVNKHPEAAGILMMTQEVPPVNNPMLNRHLMPPNVQDISDKQRFLAKPPPSSFNPNPKAEFFPDKSPLANILNKEVDKLSVTTPSTIITTSIPITTSSVRQTSDPFYQRNKYKHQQSMDSANPPMFLIIQGHSKVKTYKPTVHKNHIPFDLEITTPRSVSKFEQFVNDNTRVTTTSKKPVDLLVKAKEKPQDTLFSLLETGLNAFTPTSSIQKLMDGDDDGEHQQMEFN